ncbi:TPA: DUF2283 domain-containing protein [bacterium]|jgi:uncharacterized protein YuzE|nr:DUF2283 domain-containing protein [bacterium]
MHITIEIDGEARALYVRLQDGEIAKTIEYPEQQEIFLDLDGQGQLLGIEILDPSDIDLATILKNIAMEYGIDDLSSLIYKSLVELAA